MVILGESGRQTLLTIPKHFMSSGSALAGVPVTFVLSVLVDGQVLTQDVTAPGDVPGLLRGVHEHTSLVAMSTSLTAQNITD